MVEGGWSGHESRVDAPRESGGREVVRERVGKREGEEDRGRDKMLVDERKTDGPETDRGGRLPSRTGQRDTGPEHTGSSTNISFALLISGGAPNVKGKPKTPYEK